MDDVLVTGYSGRFGSYVVRELAAAGHKPVLFGRRQPVGEMEMYPWLKGELMRYDECVLAVKGSGLETVMHLAAQPWPTDHPRQQERRENLDLPVGQTIEVNIVGTYNILHAAMLGGVKTFVMTGSNCALGHIFRISGREFPCQGLPIDETHPSDVEDSYSFSKLANERMLEQYSRTYGMRTYSLRCAGLCDEAARRTLAEKAKPVEKWDWGLWTWVAREDAARAHRLVMEKAPELPAHDVYFCNASDTFALESSQEILEKFRPDLAKRVTEPLDGNATFISNRKLREAVGWEHETGWRQYLK